MYVPCEAEQTGFGGCFDGERSAESLAHGCSNWKYSTCTSASYDICRVTITGGPYSTAMTLQPTQHATHLLLLRACMSLSPHPIQQ